MSNKEEFFKNVLDNYFEPKTITIDGVCAFAESFGPVFGELEYSIEEKENGDKVLTLRDKHIAKSGINGKGEEVELDLDLSTTLLSLNLNKDNKVSIITHGFDIFTPMNKEAILVFTCLIGKTILFEEENK